MEETNSSDIKIYIRKCPQSRKSEIYLCMSGEERKLNSPNIKCLDWWVWGNNLELKNHLMEQEYQDPFIWLSKLPSWLKLLIILEQKLDGVVAIFSQLKIKLLLLLLKLVLPLYLLGKEKQLKNIGIWPKNVLHGRKVEGLTWLLMMEEMPLFSWLRG